MKQLKCVLLAMAAMPIVWASTANAEDNGSDGGGVETVVVTGFLGKGSLSATKLDIPVRDTPFSVSAYSGDFMKAIETTNVSDLYKYMTGIQRAGNTGFDLTIRGFKTGGNDRNAILTDGLPGLTVRFGSPPTIGVDHIEVVKGPASVLNGMEQPGGFINIITKKPEAQRAERVRFKLTAENRKKGPAWGTDGSVDLTGPIDSEGKFLYRIIGEISDIDHFRTNSNERPVYVAPSLTWNIDDNTVATVLLEFRHLITHFDDFLVAPNLDISKVPSIFTSFQQPTDFQREDGKTVTFLFTHAFANGITWNFHYRAVDHSDSQEGFNNVSIRPNGLFLQRRARVQANTRIYNAGDTYFTIPFDTAFISHKFIVGGSYSVEWDNFRRVKFFNAPPPPNPLTADISIYNPDFSKTLPLSAFPAGKPDDRVTTSVDYGFYASDMLTFSEHWKGMVGLRYARADQQLVTVAPGKATTLSKLNKNTWLPLGGLVYQPNDDLSFYASYGTSFVPQDAGAQDINGAKTFAPQEAYSVEVGTKDTFWDGRLSATLALFRIIKSNVLNSFNCPLGTCSEAIGEERSQGGELEIDARPLDSWQVIAGYAYTEATVTNSNIANQVGTMLQNVPRHDFHLWTRYDIPSGTFKGLGFGAGSTYVSGRNGTLPTKSSTKVLNLPSYTIADIALYYTFDRFDVTLKVSNLFQERYFEDAGSRGDVSVLPGTPRTILLALDARF